MEKDAEKKKELFNTTQIVEYAEKAPNKIEFEYRNVKAEIHKNATLGTLEGYLLLSVPQGSVAFDVVNECFHGGITYYEAGTIGFHTSHALDLIPLRVKSIAAEQLYAHGSVSFKTTEFVKEILENTIDGLHSRGLIVKDHIVEAGDITAVTYDHIVSIINRIENEEGESRLLKGSRYIATTPYSWIAVKVDDTAMYYEGLTKDAALDWLYGRWENEE